MGESGGERRVQEKGREMRREMGRWGKRMEKREKVESVSHDLGERERERGHSVPQMLSGKHLAHGRQLVGKSRAAAAAAHRQRGNARSPLSLFTPARYAWLAVQDANSCGNT